MSLASSASSSASAAVPNPPAPFEGDSIDHSPATSNHSSPAPNVVSREFKRALQGNSYKEIRSIIRSEIFDPTVIDPPQDQPQLVDGSADGPSQRKLLGKVLQPDRDCVQEALGQLKPNSLTHLVSTYFDHSETASELCLLLLRSLRSARIMYADLLAVLPSDSNHFTQSQFDDAFDIFLRFDTQDNPFSSDDAHNLSKLRSSFSELDQQLRRCVRKSRSKLRLLRRATTGSALCFIVTAVGVVVSAVVVTTHALVVIAAAPVCPVYMSLRKNPKKKELARLALLEAAWRVTFALKQHLDSIDRLVVLLHEAVEADKHSVRLGLEMGKNRYAIQEIIKLLRKRYENFGQLMEELEINIYISVNFVNRTRSNLLSQICVHQNA